MIHRFMIHWFLAILFALERQVVSKNDIYLSSLIVRKRRSGDV